MENGKWKRAQARGAWVFTIYHLPFSIRARQRAVAR
jgi:hypothetical protein